MRGSQQGFTLAEIATVLVLIGLLVGGILKGREMITQARIKSVIADFNGISAAYYGYWDLTGGLTGIIICSANLPDRIAIGVDTQMDDRVPSSGTVRAPAGTLRSSRIDDCEKPSVPGGNCDATTIMPTWSGSAADPFTAIDVTTAYL
jgi:prepilin-type N-terminal cleavage/methylation domain-containing protein